MDTFGGMSGTQRNYPSFQLLLYMNTVEKKNHDFFPSHFLHSYVLLAFFFFFLNLFPTDWGWEVSGSYHICDPLIMPSFSISSSRVCN